MTPAAPFPPASVPAESTICCGANRIAKASPQSAPPSCRIRHTLQLPPPPPAPDELPPLPPEPVFAAAFTPCSSAVFDVAPQGSRCPAAKDGIAALTSRCVIVNAASTAVRQPDHHIHRRTYIFLFRFHLFRPYRLAPPPCLRVHEHQRCHHLRSSL